MNPTEQSGEDLCEQPVLTWADYQKAAGVTLALLALVAFGTLRSSTSGTPAAATAALPQEETFEFMPVSDPAPTILPEAVVTSVN